MKSLSIIVPCYNEQETVRIFYTKICEVLPAMVNICAEFIFVDDGSTDDTLAEVRALRKQDKRVRYIAFSRNFGKEAAMFAGLEAAKGGYVVVMDADGQDPPTLLPEMLETLENGDFDCVATRRVTRKGEPPIRSFFARVFYRLMNKISRTEFVDGARDFRMMTRQMVDAVLQLREYNRFSKGLFSWVGFRTKWLEYENVNRVAGETKWSFFRLLTYSLDGIVAFTTAPLSIASIMGFLLCIVAAIMILVIVAKTLIWGDPVAGWPTLACIILMVGGVQLFSMGILGQYLSKAYLETKNRPIYLVRETEETDQGIDKDGQNS